MNVRNKSVVLIDKLLKIRSSASSKLDTQNQEIVFLDPVQLFSKSDWTRFDEDIEVINEIYSYVFDEVVIENKKLVCFWPLSDPFDNDWFTVHSLCKRNNYELEICKSECVSGGNYGIGGEVLRTWKRFVYFLIESLMEDLHLDEKFEEIATLTSENSSIILFKSIELDSELYTFAIESEEEKLSDSKKMETTTDENALPPFTSFQEMLLRLLNLNDLSLYQSKFSDPHLEKAYFNILGNELKIKNLIGSWILTYSMN